MFDYVFCDLDGTILYDWKRHYICYCDIVKKYGGTSVTMEHYMELKRKGIKRTVLLNETHFAGTYEEFAGEWLDRIETPEYFQYEYVKDGALETLRKWKKCGVGLSLVTMRRDRRQLLNQLQKLEIVDVFDEICCGDPTSGIKKSQLLKKIGKGCRLVLGDTEADAELARDIEATFVMFTDGLREPRTINADYYVSSWAELTEKI